MCYPNLILKYTSLSNLTVLVSRKPANFYADISHKL